MMKRSLFLLALETSAKAIRTGFATVGALTDCGMRGPVVRDSLWLTEFEEENEVFEAPLSADFDDEPTCRCAHTVHKHTALTIQNKPVGTWCQEDCGCSGFNETPVAMQGAVEDPPADESPSSAGADSSWIDFVAPAICDVLAVHEPTHSRVFGGPVFCGTDEEFCGEFADFTEWRGHISPLIAARLEAVTLESPEI